MKDYYYFLGVPKDASSEDIKKAYRKLSLKYHPDKNENDEYFLKRFQEIHEAYETLTNKESRINYDFNIKNTNAPSRSNLPPFIKAFSANKIRAQEGEEIIIKWITNNADVVKLLPFGLEKTHGERAFKISKFQNGRFQIILHAHNSFTGKTAVKAITIIQIFEGDKEDYRQETEDFFQKKPVSKEKITWKPIYGKIFILIFILLVLYLVTHLESFGIFENAEQINR